MKRCPFFQDECIKEHCELWTKLDERESRCALAAIAIKVPVELRGLQHGIGSLMRVTSQRP